MDNQLSLNDFLSDSSPTSSLAASANYAQPQQSQWCNKCYTLAQEMEAGRKKSIDILKQKIMFTDRLIGMFTQVKTSFEDARTQVKALELECERKNTEIQLINKQLKTLLADQNSSELQQLREETASLKVAVESRNDQITSMEMTRVMLEQKITSLHDEQKQKEIDWKKYNKEKDQLTKEVSKQKKTNANLERENASLLKKIEVLQDRVRRRGRSRGSGSFSHTTDSEHNTTAPSEDFKTEEDDIAQPMAPFKSPLPGKKKKFKRKRRKSTAVTASEEEEYVSKKSINHVNTIVKNSLESSSKQSMLGRVNEKKVDHDIKKNEALAQVIASDSATEPGKPNPQDLNQSKKKLFKNITSVPIAGSESSDQRNTEQPSYSIVMQEQTPVSAASLNSSALASNKRKHSPVSTPVDKKIIKLKDNNKHEEKIKHLGFQTMQSFPFDIDSDINEAQPLASEEVTSSSFLSTFANDQEDCISSDDGLSEAAGDNLFSPSKIFDILKDMTSIIEMKPLTPLHENELFEDISLFGNDIGLDDRPSISPSADLCTAFSFSSTKKTANINSINSQQSKSNPCNSKRVYDPTSPNHSQVSIFSPSVKDAPRRFSCEAPVLARTVPTVKRIGKTQSLDPSFLINPEDGLSSGAFDNGPVDGVLNETNSKILPSSLKIVRRSYSGPFKFVTPSTSPSTIVSKIEEPSVQENTSNVVESVSNPSQSEKIILTSTVHPAISCELDLGIVKPVTQSETISNPNLPAKVNNSTPDHSNSSSHLNAKLDSCHLEPSHAVINNQGNDSQFDISLEIAVKSSAVPDGMHSAEINRDANIYADRDAELNTGINRAAVFIAPSNPNQPTEANNDSVINSMVETAQPVTRSSSISNPLDSVIHSSSQSQVKTAQPLTISSSTSNPLDSVIHSSIQSQVKTAQLVTRSSSISNPINSAIHSSSHSQVKTSQKPVTRSASISNPISNEPNHDSVVQIGSDSQSLTISKPINTFEVISGSIEPVVKSRDSFVQSNSKSQPKTASKPVTANISALNPVQRVESNQESTSLPSSSTIVHKNPDCDRHDESCHPISSVSSKIPSSSTFSNNLKMIAVQKQIVQESLQDLLQRIQSYSVISYPSRGYSNISSKVVIEWLATVIKNSCDHNTVKALTAYAISNDDFSNLKMEDFLHKWECQFALMIIAVDRVRAETYVGITDKLIIPIILKLLCRFGSALYTSPTVLKEPDDTFGMFSFLLKKKKLPIGQTRSLVRLFSSLSKSIGHYKNVLDFCRYVIISKSLNEAEDLIWECIFCYPEVFSNHFPLCGKLLLDNLKFRKDKYCFASKPDEFRQEIDIKVRYLEMLLHWDGTNHGTGYESDRDQTFQNILEQCIHKIEKTSFVEVEDVSQEKLVVVKVEEMNLIDVFTSLEIMACTKSMPFVANEIIDRKFWPLLDTWSRHLVMTPNEQKSVSDACIVAVLHSLAALLLVIATKQQVCHPSQPLIKQSVAYFETIRELLVNFTVRCLETAPISVQCSTAITVLKLSFYKPILAYKTLFDWLEASARFAKSKEKEATNKVNLTVHPLLAQLLRFYPEKAMRKTVTWLESQTKSLRKEKKISSVSLTRIIWGD